MQVLRSRASLSNSEVECRLLSRQQVLSSLAVLCRQALAAYLRHRVWSCLSEASAQAVCLSKERRAELLSTLLHAGHLSKARHVVLLGMCLQAGFCPSLIALAICFARYQVFRLSPKQTCMAKLASLKGPELAMPLLGCSGRASHLAPC